MKRILTAVSLLIFIVFLAGCAAGPNKLEKTPDAEGKTAGFFLGIWHGLISPITFIVSLFSSKIRFYEVHNTGSWYNFGFILGAGLFLQGGILGSRKSRKKR